MNNDEIENSVVDEAYCSKIPRGFGRGRLNVRAYVCTGPRADSNAVPRGAARRRPRRHRGRGGRERRLRGRHPCSRCCEPLLRSRGAPAQHDLLVRVSILITCEYSELFSLSASTNGANCPNEQRNVENTRVNVGPVRVRAAATRRAATRRDGNAVRAGNVARSCSPVRFALASSSYRLKYAARDGPSVPGGRRAARWQGCPARVDPTTPRGLAILPCCSREGSLVSRASRPPPTPLHCARTPCDDAPRGHPARPGVTTLPIARALVIHATRVIDRNSIRATLVYVRRMCRYSVIGENVGFA